MPVSPLLKWMYKVFLLVVKNSSLITKLVTPLIDRLFNTINDEFKKIKKLKERDNEVQAKSLDKH